MTNGAQHTVAGNGSRSLAAEQARIRRAYAERDARLAGSDLYSLANEAHLFTVQQRQRALLPLLSRAGVWPLAGKQVLDVGCGHGGVLQELLAYDAGPAQLHGVELLPDRAAAAHRRLPHVAINCADGGRLPYADGSFDVVLQFTVFSSILDIDVCYTVASEMRRVVRPDGVILWYDFWLNPFNKHTRGIRPQEIRSYFPGWCFSLNRITLAPPLARRVVPHSWLAALLLEAAGIFNTHYLAVGRRDW